jgi:hypothetical protein
MDYAWKLRRASIFFEFDAGAAFSTCGKALCYWPKYIGFMILV